MAERLDPLLSRAHRETFRTWILVICRSAYPRRISRFELRASLEDKLSDVAFDELDIEAHYLAEKQLIAIEKPKRGDWWARITARGIDVLDGYIPEVGLAPPELFS